MYVGGKPMNLSRDWLQSTLVSNMRNGISDVLVLPQWTVSFKAAVKRTELAFFATLPPTVIYHHISVWQLVQNRRQFGNINQGFMEDGEKGVHDIVASCMSQNPGDIRRLRVCY